MSLCRQFLSVTPLEERLDTLGCATISDWKVIYKTYVSDNRVTIFLNTFSKL